MERRERRVKLISNLEEDATTCMLKVRCKEVREVP